MPDSLELGTKLIQGWQNGKGLIYFRPIFQLTKLAFFRVALKKKKKSYYTILVV